MPVRSFTKVKKKRSLLGSLTVNCGTSESSPRADILFSGEFLEESRNNSPYITPACRHGRLVARLLA